jgi:hypothetical protein
MTIKAERARWSWTSDTTRVVIYSILVTLLMLSWAYIQIREIRLIWC